MLNNIRRWLVYIVVGCFCGVGIGASVVAGAAGISGAKIDMWYLPLWLDYILLYGGFITFVLASLFLIYKCILGMLKTARIIIHGKGLGR